MLCWRTNALNSTERRLPVAREVLKRGYDAELESRWVELSCVK
jgi:hypothetical protein